ncbi:MAG: 1-phosphofructokinase family hexose kinase [Planctomycetaceae bacterium]|nr:1-phosphofructokinase family hexose kinase [Planctomycetaceae bacterium]
MILAAGLTPAFQQILTFEPFVWGEVNRARESAWCASGKVLNVGVALAHLQTPAHTLSPIGGWAREPIEHEFRQWNAPATWIATAAPTRVCTTILDRTQQQTTELVQNAGQLTPAELAEFVRAFQRLVTDATAVVLTGSLPAGTPSTIFAELLAGQTIPSVLDIRGPELLAALAQRPTLIKPNREELAYTLGRSLDTDDALLAAMRELITRGAQSVLVSQGGRPALLATHDGLWQLTPAPVAAVVNPIGCGDCLAAGVAWGLSRGLPIIDAVALGMGAAADNVSQLLPARLDRARVEQLAAQVQVAAVV